MLPAGVAAIENPRWGEGQATSIQAAVGWARDSGFDAVVIGLGDQPLIPAEAWRAVAASSSPIAVATFDGQRRPPTRLAASVWPLLPTRGRSGSAGRDGRESRTGRGGSVCRSGNRYRHGGGSGALELNHDFQVSVPIEQAWGVLTDLERIAPVHAGRAADRGRGRRVPRRGEGEGGPDHHPVQGDGQVRRSGSDRAPGRSAGRGARIAGQGAASATVTATLTAREGGTDVHIETDLDISGKVAQFGRGALGEVSGKILDQFVRDLEANVLSGPAAPAEAEADVVEAAPSKSRASGSSGATTVTTEPTRRVIDSSDRRAGRPDRRGRCLRAQADPSARPGSSCCSRSSAGCAAAVEPGVLSG